MLFISPQQLFSFYLNFCLDFLVMEQNGLIRKIRLISNFMTSKPGQQTIVIHILPNISRSKGNQIIKLDQLIECNMRHICLEKLYAKCDWETSPRTFSENFNLSISLDQKSKVLCSLYLLHAKLRAIKTFWNLADHFLLPHITLF